MENHSLSIFPMLVTKYDVTVYEELIPPLNTQRACYCWDSIIKKLVKSGFNIQKMIREFSKETDSKTDLKCHPPWLGEEEHFSL